MVSIGQPRSYHFFYLPARFIPESAKNSLRYHILVMTRGVASLPPDEVAEIMTKVRDFDEFNEDNDPWKQHDFGSFQHNGHKIFWKIDDYGGAEGFNLVLTVMLADEY